MIITTHKQFPNYKRYEIEYEGRPLVMETGKLAELCNSAVLVSYGETTVLVTCTASARPKDGVDYFPLSVDFNEKLYAVGRIPGSFMRREGKPSLPAVLASRLIDRPMRPLFPSDLRNDVIIACEVLSVDRDCSPEITAMIGASAAVSISDVPFNGPIAGIVLGWDGEKYLFNPTQEQRKTNRMTTTIAATHKKIVMIESEADQVPDDVMYEGIVQAHEHLQPVLDLIDKMVSEIGKQKFEYEHASFDEDLFELLCANEMEGMEYCMDTDDKNVREARVNEWIAAVQEKYEAEHPDMMQYMDEILYKMQKKIVKKWLLAGHRVDGRKMNEIRPLDAEVGVIPRVHGSGLFTRGQTQVLSIATLATLSMSQKLDTIWEEEEKRFMHHYNMPPYSTGDARAARSTNRREYGHGALVEKALQCVIPPVEEFPYAIRVVSEVLSSNGSTSQGSICGSTLALMDAGVPIKRPVSGVAMGLIKEGDQHVILTDIQGLEDFLGDMDFKVCGTTEGITALQMDNKAKGLSTEILAEALGQAKRGRAFILDAMLEQIPAPREELSEYAPRIITIKIPVDKIRDVIGTGGKVIRGIQEETGASIEVHEDGNVFIASVDTGGEAARKMVEDIVKVPEVGEEYEGEVVNIQSFGAFVKLTPNKDGLLHISRVANGRVGAVEDVLSEGDTVKVKVIEVDEKTGKISLDRLDKPDAPEGSSKPRNDKGHGNDRRDRDRKRDNRKPRRRD